MEELKKRAVIVITDDLEGLFVDGKLIDEGHTLGDGDKLFMMRMSDEYEFGIGEVGLVYLEEDLYGIADKGCFPETLGELFNE